MTLPPITLDDLPLADLLDYLTNNWAPQIIDAKTVIADHSITELQLAANSVTGFELVDGSVASSKIATGAVNFFKIAAGAVQTASIALPAAMVTAASQSIVANTVTSMFWTGTPTSAHGMSTGAGGIVVPTTGVYFAAGQVAYPGVGLPANNRQFTITQNGTARALGITAASSLAAGFATPTATALMLCAAGDTISATTYQDNGGATIPTSGVGGNFLSAFLVTG